MRNFFLLLCLSLFSINLAAVESVVYVGVQHDITTVNPHRSLDTITSSVVINLYDTLVRYKIDSFELEPSLAVSWQNDASFKTWTYKLRKGVTFHDGSPLTADVVVASYKTLENFPATISKVDDSTVQFVLDKGNAKFNDFLAHPNKSVIPSNMNAASSKANGTGPYMLKSRDPGVSLTLIPNPSWWDGKVKVDKVVFKIYQSEKDLLDGLIRGEVDIAEWLSGSVVPQLKKESTLKVVSKLGGNIGFLAMNVSRPPFNDLKIREAVAQRLNVVEMTRTFFPGATGAPATSFIPPSIFSFMARPTKHDPEKARASVKQAGIDTKEPLKLLEAWAPRPYMPDPAGIALEVKRALEDIGIPVKIEKDSSHFFDRIRAGDFDLCLSGWIGDSADPVEFIAANFHSDNIGGMNIPRWSNEQFDSYIDSARVLKGFEFKSTFKKALETMERELPVVPLFWGAQSAALSKRISGYSPHPSNHMRLWNISAAPKAAPSS